MLRTSSYFRTSPTKHRLCGFCPTLLIRLLYFLFDAIKPISSTEPHRMQVLMWIIHLLRDHVRWQARRLSLGNNLTPKSTRTCGKVNPGSLPLKAVQIGVRNYKKPKNDMEGANLFPSAACHGVQKYRFQFPRCIHRLERGLHLDEGCLLLKGVREPLAIVKP
jgi:hypothetical protein